MTLTRELGGAALEVTTPPGTPLTPAELAAVRGDFPILSRTVRDGRPLV